MQIVVAFLSSRKLEQNEITEDDDEDEEEDDFDFSPNSLKTKPAPKRIVELRLLRELRTGRVLGQDALVKCRLAWSWSWLQATLELRHPVTGRNSVMQQLIDQQFRVMQFHLDPGRGRAGAAAISLLLRDICSARGESGDGVLEQDRRQFCEWVGSRGEAITLSQLPDLLNSYSSEGHQEERRSMVLQLQALLEHTLPGKVFSLAINQAEFFRVAPILYPRKILSIMGGEEEEEPGAAAKRLRLLKALEDIAENYPWKFGFGDLMYKVK